MTEPTKDDLSKVLSEFGLTDLYNQLENKPVLFDHWKRRTKEDWEKYYKLPGIDIYNFLHQQREQGSPTSLTSDQALENFKELAGGNVSAEEEKILIMNFPEYYRLLKGGRLDKKGAKELHRLIKTTLKSQTLNYVRDSLRYVFGRSIGVGGGKSILQKVYALDTGNTLCAKVFMDVFGTAGSQSAFSEYEFSESVGPHENIAKFLKKIEFTHQSGSKEPLIALLMPLYPISLAELLVSFRDTPLPFTLFKQIANGLLAAGAVFQLKNLSHGDFKTNNIMMDGLKPVVIDFGAVINLGVELAEYTPGYGLDASTVNVTPEYDLFCIVTTLVQCFAPDFDPQVKTKSQMIAFLDNVCSTEMKLKEYGNICKTLLECKSSQEGQEKIKNL